MNEQVVPPNVNEPTGTEHEHGFEYDMDPAPEFEPRHEGSGRLKDKVAIITGGDSGIGRATAVLFAEEGAKVVIAYLDADRDAQETHDIVAERGGQALLVRGDVGHKEHCGHIVAKALGKFGKIDVLVNNAAEQHLRESLPDVDEAELERVFRTNFYAYFFMTQAALGHLPDGGVIINTASVTHYRGHPLLVDYASTKGAIVAFTRSLAARLAPRIRVNAVAPGPIWTPLIPKSFPPERVEEFGTHTPMGRPGQPNEVAPCFLFLACDDSTYMTGQTLHPNGGEPVAS